MLGWWTIGRATGVGAVAGLASLILWPVYAALQDAVFLPYVLSLAIAALCGLSILWITGADLLLHRRRSRKLVPIRTFDMAFAIMLSVPTLAALSSLLA
jgi:maltodextrin utilization protein YvdJ